MNKTTMITASKREIDLENFSIHQIDIVDIAHSLSMQCRFNGHVREFYSVAEHSVHTAQYFSHKGFENRIVLGALLHDAAEAYLGDIVRPVKGKLPQFRELENEIQKLIYMRFNIHLTEFDKQMISNVDNILLISEMNDLLYREIMQPTVPFTFRIQCWPPTEAKIQFLNVFYLFANEGKTA